MKPFAMVVLFSFGLALQCARAEMHGSYYIGIQGSKPGGGNPDFSTLKAACDVLNANSGNITSDCTFYITSDLTESSNVAIGSAAGSATITFKPAPGLTPIITFTKPSDNAGISGAWVIGATDLSISSSAVTVNNIVIDGSNTAGGTTRDLTIATAAVCNGNTTPLRFFGDVNACTIKHCIVKAGQSASYAVLLTVRNTGGVNYVPDEITIEHCAIGNTAGPSGQAIAISNSGTPTAFPKGIVIRDNLLEASYRGIFLNYAGTTRIDGNEIRISQSNSTSMNYGIHGSMIGSASDSTTICNNRLTMLSASECASGSDAGITGIHCGSKGVYTVFNNMITGFSVDGSASPVKAIGIRATTGANVYFNSIYLGPLEPGAAASLLYCGIYVSGGKSTMMNNIICSHEESDSVFGIWYAGGTLTSDYNDYCLSGVKGCTGSFKGAPKTSLSEWQAAGQGDAHSTYANPVRSFGSSGSWLSPADLHWRQVPAAQFAGVAITGIEFDIDGDPRNPIPTMGVDESEVPLPVELVSFDAVYADGLAVLEWTTAGELNNYGFEIERAEPKDCFSNKGYSAWTQAGFVEGHGTTTLPHFYEFTERCPCAGTLYRLKQLDRDGGFRYSQEIAAAAIVVSASYALEQNYPNPFNPETEVQYTIPVQQRVRLSVFDVGGREVTTLVDSTMPPGTYTVVWNAQHAPAGIYFYRLIAGPFMGVRKLVLIK
ncbi:MAG TPA: T9SS type A sorting domain-containing protein [Bacteroidota bacterium]|nr:T9SS type A sorting domain-containing protein [Bacteroidota bacterium]